MQVTTVLGYWKRRPNNRHPPRTTSKLISRVSWRPSHHRVELLERTLVVGAEFAKYLAIDKLPYSRVRVILVARYF